jgi:predicted translin family RNA/ssDNA-binding protein
VAKIRGDLEKANRKAEDQDFLLQKIEAKLAAFDDIYKKLASFVSRKLLAYLYVRKTFSSWSRLRLKTSSIA